MYNEETIAAIATPYGEGAIGVIRISGTQAFNIASEVFSKDVSTFKSHSAHYGKVLGKDKAVIDHVLLLIMKSPKSYTGEDCVEIQCHGGIYITRSILKRVIEAGAKPAMPGEFTKRAYLNGKIDLVQAESVQTLIAAKNTFAAKAAKSQLEGKLSEKIALYQNNLFEIAAILEAWVDFPEEDLEFASFTSIIDRLEKLAQEMTHFSNTFENGQKILDSISVCLIGSPNVGKSSLMNILLQKDRAIVSDIAGTTRDTIEEEMLLNGINLRLIDTAGIRKTTQSIEKKGIERTKNAMGKADIILFILDASKPIANMEKQILASLNPNQSIVVINKIDLHEPVCIDFPNVVKISVKKKTNLSKLNFLIKALIEKNEHHLDEVILTNLRHKKSLDKAISCVEQVIHGLQNEVSAEFVSFDIRQALVHLSEIIGKDVTEEILNSIFSTFCLGK